MCQKYNVYICDEGIFDKNLVYELKKLLKNNAVTAARFFH